MIWVLSLLTIWVLLAVVAAVALGRVATRADDEELGSTKDWDLTQIDHAEKETL